jgi:two-component system, sensor histidine kinase PdtaS
VASLSELARAHTDLGSDARAHLRRLVGSWGLLADFCFADLLLFAPARGGDRRRLVVLGQIRPTTAQTLYRDDQVGRFVDSDERPLVGRALAEGVIVEGDLDIPTASERVRVLAVPVRHRGEVVAVLTRESPRLGSRLPGELERTYLAIFHRLARMIVDGTYPFPHEDAESEDAPRVGDGVILLDAEGRCSYTSPNAVSALHRVGFHANAVGRHLEDLGFPTDVVRTAYRLQVPVIEELERGLEVSILSRCLPLINDGTVDGAVVLLRDVSDLRRRDRLLVSKDATIREIHHRVKNNLQTVSSLLRLQGRRMAAPEAKAAIDESVRRIRSIALVHEILSHGQGDDVSFAEVVQPIVDMVSEALVAPDRPITFRVVGEGPRLQANMASSLAVVLTELLQNAVEHGYPPGSAGGTVTIELATSPTELVVRVHDDGAGLPPDFDSERTSGLGLTIVRTLAYGDLGGRVNLRPVAASGEGNGSPAGGAVAELVVALTGPAG